MMTYTTEKTWVQFIAGEGGRLQDQSARHKSSASNLVIYQIDDVVSVTGMPPTGLVPGLGMIRIESSTPISLPDERDNSPVVTFSGMTQHLHYTDAVQKKELADRSRAELGPSPITRAVLIPIGKSSDWWRLPQDQRYNYFQTRADRPGHTAIGVRYVDRVFRKLYHSRYMNPEAPYDFLTYFEFDDAHRDDFKSLVGELRDRDRNPEWTYVSFEYEIWMTKTECT